MPPRSASRLWFSPPYYLQLIPKHQSPAHHLWLECPQVLARPTSFLFVLLVPWWIFFRPGSGSPPRTFAAEKTDKYKLAITAFEVLGPFSFYGRFFNIKTICNNLQIYLEGMNKIRSESASAHCVFVTTTRTLHQIPYYATPTKSTDFLVFPTWFLWETRSLWLPLQVSSHIWIRVAHPQALWVPALFVLWNTRIRWQLNRCDKVPAEDSIRL